MSTPKTPRAKRSGKERKQQRKRHTAPKPLTDFEIVLVDTLDDVRTTPAHKRRIALRIGGVDKDVVSLRVDSDQARARLSTAIERRGFPAVRGVVLLSGSAVGLVLSPGA